MRSFGGAWPVIPVGAALFLIASPETGDPALRLIAVASVGVSLTLAVANAYIRSRIEPIVAVAERLAAGETDVIVPIRHDPLGRRLSVVISALAERVARSDEDASTDRLTGTPNRVGIVGALFNEVERSVRYRRPLAVVFADIDHFKTINDTYGHEAGDLVLKGVADALRTNGLAVLKEAEPG